MAPDSSKVGVALTGAVSYAPTTEPAPTDAETTLDSNWRNVGYISEDGVVETRDRSTNNIIAWQNADVIRVVTTEASIAVQFSMIESNPNSIELYYGSAVNDTDGSVEIVPRASGGRRSFVVDYVDGDKFVRLYIPAGELTETGDKTLSNGEADAYDVTITGYPATVGSSTYSAKKWFSDLVVTP